MKKTILSAIAIMMLISLSLTGCGNDHSNATPTIVTQIFTDQAFDGDILENPPGVFTITQGMSSTVQSVFAGIDPSSGAESRAFLDFPLSGPNGVPINAVIVSATLDIVIDSIQPPAGTIPIRIDLVSLFQPPILQASDFDTVSQPALAITTIPISSTNIPKHVLVDVTSLMVEAQNRGLPDFQIRLLLDFSAFSGLIEIDDTTGAFRSSNAPLLQVEYF